MSRIFKSNQYKLLRAESGDSEYSDDEFESPAVVTPHHHRHRCDDDDESHRTPEDESVSTQQPVVATRVSVCIRVYHLHSVILKSEKSRINMGGRGGCAEHSLDSIFYMDLMGLLHTFAGSYLRVD